MPRDEIPEQFPEHVYEYVEEEYVEEEYVDEEYVDGKATDPHLIFPPETTAPLEATARLEATPWVIISPWREITTPSNTTPSKPTTPKRNPGRPKTPMPSHCGCACHKPKPARPSGLSGILYVEPTGFNRCDLPRCLNAWPSSLHVEYRFPRRGGSWPQSVRFVTARQTKAHACLRLRNLPRSALDSLPEPEPEPEPEPAPAKAA